MSRLFQLIAVAGVSACAIATAVAQPQAVSVNVVTGRYITSSDQPQFSDGDSYTVCRPAPKMICLRPARLDRGGAWKPNLASTISTFRLETGPAHFRSRQKEKP